MGDEDLVMNKIHQDGPQVISIQYFFDFKEYEYVKVMKILRIMNHLIFYLQFFLIKLDSIKNQDLLHQL